MLKWIFTFLAILWFYRLLRQVLQTTSHQRHFHAPPQPPPARKPEGTVEIQRRKDDDDADFIDYEEIS